MTTTEMDRANSQRLETVQAALGDGVRLSEPFAGRPPLWIEPLAPELGSDIEAAAAWVEGHRNAIEAALRQFGGIVWRGFAVKDTAAFERFLGCFTPFAQGYVGGTSPRSVIAGNVMEATSGSPTINITMHQEMAYMRSTPRLLAFYCKVPSETGGETVIADMRGFMEALPEKVQRKLQEHGVRYVRNFWNEETPDDWRADPYYSHASWQSWFNTRDRDLVAAQMTERGADVRWNEDGSLTTWTILPAMTTHPATGDRLFFNQIYAMRQHRVTVGAEKFERMEAAYPNYLDRPQAASYGNGDPLLEPEYMAMHEEMERRKVAFPWRSGDVMLLDNKFVAHGRHPYTGRRDVQVLLFD